jgi:hypothetical protein
MLEFGRRPPLAGAHVILLSLLFRFVAWPAAEQVRITEQPSASSDVVTIEAPLVELNQRYLRWIHHHPEVMQQPKPLIPPPPPGEWPNSSAGSNRDVTPLLIRMPSIDLYSPTGVSLYHGTDSDKNAKFIRGLPHGIPSGSAVTADELRPTLQEAMEMFSELKQYASAPAAKKEYTVFALTYPDVTRKAQNEAMEELKNRAGRIGFRVIEVRLQK